MKVLGAGLSKTGTMSLTRALEILGYSTIHCDTERMGPILFGSESAPDFRLYDDVDAVTDLPTAFFFRELLQAYPDLLVILTVRAEDDWWRSAEHHFNVRFPVSTVNDEFDRFRYAVRTLAYGSTVASEFLFRKRFREHNDQVVRSTPPDRLLVMDIVGGDGWATLCPFLGVPAPTEDFPHVNRSDRPLR